MSRPAKVLLTTSASIAVAALGAGCGTQKIKLSPSNPLYQGAVLFSQRCSGCHTLSYAATNGSAANPRTAEFNNGPNFDVRCERPAARVLYAIENGGFSGGIMPQNVVVGQDAIEVAKFVATYSGTKAAVTSGLVPCSAKPVGMLPPTPVALVVAAAATHKAKTAFRAVTPAPSGKKAALVKVNVKAAHP